MNYELELAKALNRRDAYGGIVSQLINWFSDDESGPFEREDFQAAMMDAGLMDEDYQLRPFARELFNADEFPSQIEELAEPATPSSPPGGNEA